MTCRDGQLDYLCEGWRQRRVQILQRDGYRCRGCNRSTDKVNLEVHHRRYGRSGLCGACPLTGVEDTDLVTLCGDGGCHKAVDAVRRTHRTWWPPEPVKDPINDNAGKIVILLAIMFAAIIVATLVAVSHH